MVKKLETNFYKLLWSVKAILGRYRTMLGFRKKTQVEAAYEEENIVYYNILEQNVFDFLKKPFSMLGTEWKYDGDSQEYIYSKSWRWGVGGGVARVVVIRKYSWKKNEGASCGVGEGGGAICHRLMRWD